MLHVLIGKCLADLVTKIIPVGDLHFNFPRQKKLAVVLVL